MSETLTNASTRAAPKRPPGLGRKLLGVSGIVAVSVVATLSALIYLQTKANDARGSAAMEERFCAQAHADCHPNVTPAESAATLASWKQETSARVMAVTPGQNSVPLPGYVSLPLVMNDRIKADSFLTRASEQVQTRMLPVAAQSALLSNAKFSVSTALETLLVLVATYVALGKELKPLSRVERKLVAEGGVDTWSAYRTFMTRKLRIPRLGLRVVLVGFPTFAGLFGAPVLGLGGGVYAAAITYGLLLIPCLFTLAMFFDFARKEAFERGLLGIQGKERNVRRAAPKVEARAEHGSARHAADDELHSKGFAEREGPSTTEIAEHLNSLSAKERAELADKMGAVFTRRADGGWTISEKGSR